MRRALLVLPFVACLLQAGCDTPPNEIDMQIAPAGPACTSLLVHNIGSIAIEADGNDPATGTCLLDRVCVRIDPIMKLNAEIADVDAQISDKLPTLLDVETDRLIQIGVTGYTANNCTGDTMVLCGRANVSDVHNDMLTVTVNCSMDGIGLSCTGFGAGYCPAP